jgi:outer membrane receptor protein involved in Fe transport
MATNYELDYTHTMPDLKIGDNVVPATFKASLFYKTSQDMLGLTNSLSNPSIGATNFLVENVGSSKSTGLELALKGNLNTDWRWGANYTYEVVDASVISDATGTPLYNIGVEDSTPRHLANINLGYSKDKWEGDVYGHFVSSRKMLRDTTSTVPLDGTSISTDTIYGMSARIAYELTDGLTLSLSGSNLQSANSKQTSGPEVERAVWLGLTWDY